MEKAGGDIRKWEVFPLGALEVNSGQVEGLPSNPRTITKERFEALCQSIKDAPEMLELRPLIGVRKGEKVVIIAGNMRLKALQELGWAECPVIALEEGTPSEVLREYTMKDNTPYGEMDWDMVANEWDAEELKGWGVELPDDWEEGSEDDNTYTRKVEIPTYEPSGKKWGLADLADTRKRDELVARIEVAEGVPDDVRAFLKMAAERHVVFDFGKIADWYADAPKAVQELMEDSALVLLDIDKGVAGGYVKMVDLLLDLVKEEEGVS